MELRDFHLDRKIGGMSYKKSKKQLDNAIRCDVKKEMAQPRMARSAKIAELKLDTARVPEQASNTLSGTVGTIIPYLSPSKPEKAEIVVDGPERGYRDLRMENEFTDKHGDDAKLKKGAHVEITVTEDQKE
jgi:hypothetical protein